MAVLYSYQCKKCEKIIDRWFDMGKAKSSINCDVCKGKAERLFTFNAKIPDPVSDARIGRGGG